jgi:uncharacterized protein YhjY with autotransporter beta-barrel domain
VDIDAYTETGDPVLTNNIGEQDLKALKGSAGIEARANYALGRFDIQPYGSAMLEKDFEGDSRTVRYAGTASPTILNSFVLPDRTKDMYGRLTGGANVGLGANTALQVNASTTMGQDGPEELGGFIGVKIGF